MNVVGFDRQDAGQQVEFDDDLVGDSVAVGESIDVANELIEIEAGEARGVALEHVAQPMNDFGGPFGVRADVGERGTRLPKVGLRCVEEVDSGGGVDEDRGEWLGYFVHNGCGELAQGGHACNVLQLCPLLLEFPVLLRG